MRIVTLEEHFQIPNLIQNAGLKTAHGLRPEIQRALGEIGPKRLKDMDEAQITMQVLSAAAPGADLLDGDEGIAFAKAVNNELAARVKEFPSRFAGFAHLPLREPEAAADELERAIKDLKFCGALINGTTQGVFWDDLRFTPLLKRAEELDVPLYVHPALPPEPVRKAYYENLPGGRGLLLAMAGYGWHVETGLHILRMALGGTFARHPRLKIIIGHMGETLQVMLDRADQVFAGMDPSLEVKATILKHLWVTTSGFFSLPPFQSALMTFGIDRLLFSVDYPFASSQVGSNFLKSLALSTDDLEKLAYRNADKLLRLER